VFSIIICSFVLGKIKNRKLNSKHKKTEAGDKDTPFLIQLQTGKHFKEWK
jgi:hypothetical protein